MNAPKKLTDTDFKCFRVIIDFVNDLGKEFGPVQKSLALYTRIISHTNFSHTAAIERHNEAFNKFIRSNQDAIETSDVSKLSDDHIVYSDNIFISMKPILNIADEATKKVIWQHLLTIYGVMYPDSNAKELLKKMKDSNPESDLIQTIVNQITPHLDEANSDNPMSAIMGLVSSGAFTKVIETLQTNVDSGNVDMASLIGTATSFFNNGGVAEEKKK